MANNVASISSVTVPVTTTGPVSAQTPTSDNARADDDPSRFRLTIEATSAGRFVYKVLDRVTGEVIRQLPREEVVRLSQDPTYSGGKVVDTTV